MSVVTQCMERLYVYLVFMVATFAAACALIWFDSLLPVVLQLRLLQ